MGKRNYLIEGVSGTGKSTVHRALCRRGYKAIDGDRELAYQGDPETGQPTETASHEHHIWDLEQVRAHIANQDDDITFFCGGSRNFHHFVELLDGVCVLDVDIDTLNRRLDQRTDNNWGKTPEQRALIVRLHTTKEDLPKSAVIIDATQPISDVVDDILRVCT